MMGSGKTTIGKLLAKELKCPFFDLDDLMEKKLNLKISEYFLQYGEASFRKEERKILFETLLKSTLNSPPIIASGGGIVTSDTNLQIIRKKTLSIWLNAHPEVLYQRIKKETHRPLLYTKHLPKGEDPKTKLYQLYKKRKPLYQQADLIIKTDHQSLENITKTIINELKNRRFSAYSKNNGSSILN